MEKKNRYPGTRPFLENDRELFFGRNTDIEQLTKLIVREKLVVLFSKSGYGKSSLLNAGVIPRLTELEKYKVLSIRLIKKERNPEELLIHYLKSSKRTTTFLENKFNIASELPDDLTANLWYYAKTIQVTQKNSTAIVLIFDQFEELFNFPDTQVEAFSRIVATLLKLKIPEAVRRLMKQKMKSDASYFTKAETDQLLEPLNLKVVFSLRKDHLSLLNQLKSALPAVFNKTYELQPLDENQALEALLEPAAKEGKFASPVFSYTNAATALIINSLKDGENQGIEAFQLQLICQHAEELIIGKQHVNPITTKYKLSDTELGEPENIFESYYKVIIDDLPLNSQREVRLLIEDKLIIAGNRIPLPTSIISEQYQVPESLLKILVDKRLLRPEPNAVGGTSFELSHNTLVGPILKVAKVRRQKEEEEKAEKKLQKERRKLQEKRQRARRRSLLVMGALVIASALALFGFYQMNKAKQLVEVEKQKYTIDSTLTVLKKEKERSDYMLVKIDSTLTVFKQEKERTDNMLVTIDSTLKVVKKEKERTDTLFLIANLREREAQKEKAKSDTARVLAEVEKTKAQQLAEGVLALLKHQLPAGVSDVYGYYQQRADTEFEGGDYNNALGFYQGAKLLANDTEQANRINTKMNTTLKCIELIEEAGEYVLNLKLDSAIATYKLLQKINPDDPKAAWRIEAFSRTVTWPILQSLNLVTVKGGTFMMGGTENEDEKPIHKVLLTEYKIGRYEITNRKYAEFLNQYGSTTVKEGVYKTEVMIVEDKWGIKQTNDQWHAAKGKENHPVVMVSWYGAYEFCRFYGLSLPTEAQWEYAARGGEKSQGFIYSGSDDHYEVEVYDDNSGGKTNSIGGKKPNELGIYDMSGNVWEWCHDWYSFGY